MSWCRRCSSSGAVASTAFATTLASSSGFLASVTFPRATRETSSRSSTSRTRCWAWRRITSRSRGVATSPAQLHELGGGEDRRERVAQLVRQQRQEFVLAAIGLAHGGLRLLESRHVDEGPDRAARRAARIAQRNGVAVEVNHLPVVEADLLFVVSHFDAARGSLQRELLGRNLDVVHEHLEVPRGRRVDGRLRQVLSLGRCARARVPVRLPRISRHSRILRDPHGGGHRVHQRRELVGARSRRASLCRNAASAARRSVTSVATLTRQGSPPKSMRALATSSVRARPSLVR